MMLDEPLLIVNECLFLENESNSGSVLYSLEILVRYIAIQNSVFMNNGGRDSVIGGMYTTLTLSSCNITNNTIKAIYFTKKSIITLINCLFAFQSCSTSSKGCFITITINSIIVIKSSFVTDVKSLSEGGFLYLESSNLTIDLLTVRQVFATKGACIEATKYSNVIIKTSTFQYYSPECMYFSDSILLLQNVNITDSLYTLAKLSNDLLIGSSAITMINCPMIVISACLVKNNMGITKNGGAMYIQMLGQNNGMSVISDSVFTMNSALSYGGAIYINNQNITLLRNSFVNNTAQYGGAIYLDCYGK